MKSTSEKHSITVEQVTQLPQCHMKTIPVEFLDEYEHMNVGYYIDSWRRGANGFTKILGIDDEYREGGDRGLWLLRQVLDYLAEIRVNETISIHGRMVRRTAKLMHNKYWMVNETTGRIAAMSEVLVANADLTLRKIVPISEEACAKMDRHLAEVNALGWEPPVSGAIQL